MTRRISILDPITANQIAAGEVVERPVSVIKELVENALDAGANKIEIEIKGAGTDLIRVTDNGSGMDREDALLAFERHATSKIHTPSDLNNIKTLGFRGEALPSISSVSIVEVITREAVSPTGTRLRLEGGRLIDVEDAGTPAGTTMLVKDLFYNTPARRKFLKTQGVEAGQINDLISRYGMAFPQVSFKLINQGKTVFLTPGNGKLLEVISIVYGNDVARQMIPVRAEGLNLSLEGYLGKPSLTRVTRAYQSFFLNNRYIKSKLLTQAVNAGYHTLIPVNRFPLAVLKLSIPFESVDVNVHPTKMEVRFAHEGQVEEFVAAAIKDTLRGSVLIPGLQELRSRADESTIVSSAPDPLAGKAVPVSETGSVDMGQQPSGPQKHFNSVQHSSLYESSRGSVPLNPVTALDPFVASNRDNGLSQSGSGYQSGNEVFHQTFNVEAVDSMPTAAELEETEDVFRIGTSNLAETRSLNQETSLETGICQDSNSYQVQSFVWEASPGFPESEPTSPGKLPEMLPLGQVDATYIVARGGAVLYIIDQHAAHERINFEELWARAETGKIHSQTMLEPLTLELTNQEMGIMLENIAAFTELGFLLEHFGGNTFLLRGKPADLELADARQPLRDLLELFADGTKKFESRQLRQECIYMLACKSSIKARESLRREEMEQLIYRLGQTENPFSCPHGRPTIIAITVEELAKRFLRT